MPRKEKTPQADIMAFYVGGAKIHATTTHTKDELNALMEGAMVDKPSCRIDTINEDPDIFDDSLTLLFDKMLFYTVIEPNRSGIQIVSDNNNKGR